MPNQPTNSDTLLNFSIESLENRLLLAGDVEAYVTNGGDLIIRGDDASNAVILFAPGNPGEFRVTGLQTTINGSSQPLDLSGVTGDVKIDLRNGDNGLLLRGTMVVNGDLRIDTRSGNDQVEMDANLTVDGDLRINTRGGDDAVESSTSSILVSGQDFRISTGQGDDSITLKGLDMLVDRDLRITTGSGVDDIRFDFDDDFSMGRDLRVNSGRDADEIYYDGNESEVERDARISTGEGDDFIHIQNSDVVIDEELVVRTGSGEDYLSISDDIHVNVRISITMGSDDDTAVFKDFDFSQSVASYTVNGGSGDDLVDGLSDTESSNFETFLMTC